jgi:hypothetical protein
VIAYANNDKLQARAGAKLRARDQHDLVVAAGVDLDRHRHGVAGRHSVDGALDGAEVAAAVGVDGPARRGRICVYAETAASDRALTGSEATATLAAS